MSTATATAEGVAESPPLLLSISQLAEMLQMSVSGIHVQRHRGQEPGALGFMIGRKVYYRFSEIEAFLDQKSVEAAALADRLRAEDF